MTAAGTRVSRPNHRHMAIVREARDQLDRMDPDWRHRLLDQRRAAREAADLPSRRVGTASNVGE